MVGEGVGAAPPWTASAARCGALLDAPLQLTAPASPGVGCWWLGAACKRAALLAALLAQQAESAQTALEQSVVPGQAGIEAMWSDDINLIDTTKRYMAGAIVQNQSGDAELKFALIPATNAVQKQGTSVRLRVSVAAVDAPSLHVETVSRSDRARLTTACIWSLRTVLPACPLAFEPARRMNSAIASRVPRL